MMAGTRYMMVAVMLYFKPLLANIPASKNVKLYHYILLAIFSLFSTALIYFGLPFILCSLPPSLIVQFNFSRPMSKMRLFLIDFFLKSGSNRLRPKAAVLRFLHRHHFPSPNCQKQFESNCDYYHICWLEMLKTRNNFFVWHQQKSPRSYSKQKEGQNERKNQ